MYGDSTVHTQEGQCPLFNQQASKKAEAGGQMPQHQVEFSELNHLTG